MTELEPGERKPLYDSNGNKVGQMFVYESFTRAKLSVRHDTKITRTCPKCGLRWLRESKNEPIQVCGCEQRLLKRKDEVIRRLCELSGEVGRYFSSAHAYDCFCSTRTPGMSYDYSETVLKFIESAVREKLEGKQPCDSCGCIPGVRVFGRTLEGA